MKLTPKQERLLQEYCKGDSLITEFVIETAKFRNLTIEQTINQLKQEDEESLYLIDDIVMD